MSIEIHKFDLSDLTTEESYKLIDELCNSILDSSGNSLYEFIDRLDKKADLKKLEEKTKAKIEQKKNDESLTRVVDQELKKLKKCEEETKEKIKAQHNQHKRVYICSPYQDSIQNLKFAKKYCREAIIAGYIPIAPHLYFPEFLDDTDEAERTIGLECALSLLCDCSEIWVYGKPTPGMTKEIDLAKKLGIKIINK